MRSAGKAIQCRSLSLLAHRALGRSSAFGELRMWEDIRLGEGTQPCSST